MSKKLPTLSVQNPILLRLFLLGWEEDWDWGSPTGQFATALIIHDFAAKIADKDTRKQLQTIAAKEVAKGAQNVARQFA